MLKILLFFIISVVDLMAEGHQNLVVSSEITARFIAKFCLFLGLVLLFTILVAKILKLTTKIPVIAGQIIAGILLGPSFLNIASWKFFSDSLVVNSMEIISSDLFVFLILIISSAFTVSYLLWLAGYETNISEMIKVGPAAILAGFLGAIIPIIFAVFGIFLTLGLGCPVVTAIGVGLIFSATSVSIPVAMLVSQKKMHLRSSKATLGAAIIDDIFAVILLSFFIVLLQSDFFSDCQIISGAIHTHSVLNSIFRILASFALFFVVGMTVIPFLNNLFNKNRFLGLIAPTAFCFMLFYFSFAELFGGLAGITGAYFAGIFQRRVDINHLSEATLTPFINSILLPLFLVSVGLQLDITTLTFYDWIIALVLLILAILSKFFGVYIATFISNIFFETKKWTCLESYIFGSSMVARGEVGLVIATLLKNMQVINLSLYTISVVVIILTTILTPILLSFGFRLSKKTETTEIKTLKLTGFDIVTSKFMFAMLMNLLEKTKHSCSYIKLSESHIVADFQKDKVDIIYSPEGITLRGKYESVDQFMGLFLRELNSDLNSIKKASEALH
ncbi:MAG: hypothetical protein A3F11_11140 [Gammaproteobacteria bacterium RIFCSPHIGHO2_12_FULL_37_14]|nr:MAG: hypothetical protein A3F11_11140 [Gammaproteobacteria bacterium RIFCSPHIGHO2_12_FULL_37_14]